MRTAVWTFIRRRGLRVYHQRRDVRADSAGHRIRMRHRAEPQEDHDHRHGPDDRQLLHRWTGPVHAAQEVRTTDKTSYTVHYSQGRRVNPWACAEHFCHWRLILGIVLKCYLNK